SCPEAEDIPGRVHVPVVEHTTLHASPASYSQPVDAVRPAKRAARRTGAGGVRLANLSKDDACVIAFIFQHRLELAPAGIQYRLGHAGLRELGGRDVAHHDFAVLTDQPAGELVQGVLATILDLGVDSLHSA